MANKLYLCFYKEHANQVDDQVDHIQAEKRANKTADALQCDRHIDIFIAINEHIDSRKDNLAQKLAEAIRPEVLVEDDETNKAFHH